jgi:hypothetical protein
LAKGYQQKMCRKNIDEIDTRLEKYKYVKKYQYLKKYFFNKLTAVGWFNFLPEINKKL